MRLVHVLKVQHQLRQLVAKVEAAEDKMQQLMEQIWPAGCVVLVKLQGRHKTLTRMEVLGHQPGSDGGWLLVRTVKSGKSRRIPAAAVQQVETYPGLASFVLAKLRNEK